MRQIDPWDLEEEVKRPADARGTLASSYHGSPVLRPAIVRCTWCGREVREDWTPEQSPDEQLCGRCVQMVRDPDALKP